MYKIIFFIFFFVNMLIASNHIVTKFEFREDESNKNIAPLLHPKSHINIFLPSIPYSYILKTYKCRNQSRSCDNEQGWIAVWQIHEKS
ncbi:MAG: hypothetical protein U5K55_03470 [Aliarcobacter sp.]|nr:hypothetical protein [Aliarcobacter sp.]